jgi:hypothetical protein
MDSPTPHTMHPGSTAFKPLTCMLDNTTMTNIRSYVRSNSCVQANMHIIIATFLLGNYKQVTQLLEELPGAITALQSGKSPEDMYYHRHLQTERQYLLSRKEESPNEEFACEYVQQLIMHQKAK